MMKHFNVDFGLPCRYVHGMGIVIHKELVQGSSEWLDARRATLTASEMHLIITPSLKVANNDKSRSHLYELLAQYITGYVEPHYISDDMLRGKEEEIYARQHYEWNFEPVEEVGFITNDSFGFKLGFSPDGLVGDDGIIEIKSRRQKYQVQTIIEDAVPEEYMLQIQTGLLVSGRKWCDFISYHGGLPMYPKRVEADPVMQAAILDASRAFYEQMAIKLVRYNEMLANPANRLVPTERLIYSEEDEIEI